MIRDSLFPVHTVSPAHVDLTNRGQKVLGEEAKCIRTKHVQTFFPCPYYLNNTCAMHYITPIYSIYILLGVIGTIV
jgi:hypothetical protein